ncbi:SDR family NAD(P)-dependent oxidoreductase [Pseudomonas sp. NPDC077186]|uniref:SDR family NAD(P)-dependent oxidoreductase n=1 Tax=Pseudomonas sp. NPDC077186 TaxID=3364421 RepID=UPI0037C6E304
METAASTFGRLAGKVAIITGGASGIGRASALSFLDQGAKVVIADLNDDTAEETLALAAQRGHSASIRFLRTDVSCEEDIAAVVALALKEFTRLDCFFSNAGAGGAMGPITQTSTEDWDRTVALLLRSVFLGIKYAGNAMKRQGSGGSIINTSSTAGLNAGSGPAAYSAAKAGVVNLTQSAAVELAPARIRVNNIAPGGIYTPLIRGAKNEQEMHAFMKGRLPWPAVGLPEDIANAALFLASDESRFCTGTTLLVDGGLLAWGPGLYPFGGIYSEDNSFSAGNATSQNQAHE